VNRIERNQGLYFVIISNSVEQYKTEIKDYSAIPDEYKTYVLKAYGLRLLSGYEDKSFRYNGILNRAEACAVIIRFMNTKDKQVADMQKSTQSPVSNKNIDQSNVNITDKVIIIPYECEKNPSGVFIPDITVNDDSAYQMILFNNKMSLEEQFKVL
jgi:hypothetical protein